MADPSSESTQTAKMKVVICPYCGETQPASERCRVCQGLFEPLSRQATHNAMGPWFIRNPSNPHQPGCSYEMLVKMVDRGQINRYTIVRGPTTKQFWTVARHTPGVAHLLGYCHNCDAAVSKKDLGCAKCGAPFGAYLERNYMGLPEIKPLPWESDTPDATDQWGTHFGPPRPQATGLSSFGTDEELAAGGGRMGSPAMVSPRMNGGTGVGTATAPAGVASSSLSVARVLDDDSSHAAARQRTLERRLNQQQQSIRWLLVAVGAVVLIALLFAFDVFSGGSEEASTDGNDGSVDAAEDEASGSDEVESVSLSEDTSDQITGYDRTEYAPHDAPKASLANGRETEVQIVPEQIPETSNAGDTARPQQPDPFAIEFDRAQGLLRQARDENVEIDARIAAMTDAIGILEQLSAVAPPESHTVLPAEELEALRTELKRLETKKWFD